MGLYERWTASGEDPSKIRIHPFGTALREAARGAITREQLIAGFGLAGDDVTELDAIIDKYVGLTTQGEKDRFIVLLHDVMILAADHQTRPLYTREFTLQRLGF